MRLLLGLLILSSLSKDFLNASLCCAAVSQQSVLHVLARFLTLLSTPEFDPNAYTGRRCSVHANAVVDALTHAKSV